MVDSINNTVTELEDRTMHFLSDKMEATASMVGEYLYNKVIKYGPSNYSHIGGSVLSNLRKKGYSMRLPELTAWRLTREGRKYVTR